MDDHVDYKWDGHHAFHLASGKVPEPLGCFGVLHVQSQEVVACESAIVHAVATAGGSHPGAACAFRHAGVVEEMIGQFGYHSL